MARRPQLTGRAAILAVVVCAIAMSLAYPFREYLAQRRQIAELEQQEVQALRKLRELEERQRLLQDPEYVKQQARARLHMCAEGEKCYVVLDEPVRQRSGADERAAERPPWYQTIWESVQAADKGTGKKADSP